MIKVIVKLSIDTLFEYTDEKNNIVWIDTIKRFTENKSNSCNIGFSGHKLEDYRFEILKKKHHNST
jgi:hypothetical protein